MNYILLLKKYLPGILYTVLALVILYLIYKMVKRTKGAVDTVADTVTDKAEAAVLSQKTGIPVAKIALLRKDVFALAHDLNTLKDMSWLDKAKNLHVQFDSDTLKRFSNVKSAEEMSLFKNMYQDEYTDKNVLLTDIQGTLSADNLKKVPFISTIY